MEEGLERVETIEKLMKTHTAIRANVRCVYITVSSSIAIGKYFSAYFTSKKLNWGDTQVEGENGGRGGLGGRGTKRYHKWCQFGILWYFPESYCLLDNS
jgi:hypothetical protein